MERVPLYRKASLILSNVILMVLGLVGYCTLNHRLQDTFHMVVDYAKCQPLVRQNDKKVRLLDLLTKRAGGKLILKT
jgi:hypothetical protein